MSGSPQSPSILSVAGRVVVGAAKGLATLVLLFVVFLLNTFLNPASWSKTYIPGQDLFAVRDLWSGRLRKKWVNLCAILLMLLLAAVGTGVMIALVGIGGGFVGFLAGLTLGCMCGGVWVEFASQQEEAVLPARRLAGPVGVRAGPSAAGPGTSPTATAAGLAARQHPAAGESCPRRCTRWCAQPPPPPKEPPTVEWVPTSPPRTPERLPPVRFLALNGVDGVTAAVFLVSAYLLVPNAGSFVGPMMLSTVLAGFACGIASPVWSEERRLRPSLFPALRFALAAAVGIAFVLFLLSRAGSPAWPRLAQTSAAPSRKTCGCWRSGSQRPRPGGCARLGVRFALLLPEAAVGLSDRRRPEGRRGGPRRYPISAAFLRLSGYVLYLLIIVAVFSNTLNFESDPVGPRIAATMFLYSAGSACLMLSRKLRVRVGPDAAPEGEEAADHLPPFVCRRRPADPGRDGVDLHSEGDVKRLRKTPRSRLAGPVPFRPVRGDRQAGRRSCRRSAARHGCTSATATGRRSSPTCSTRPGAWRSSRPARPRDCAWSSAGSAPT